ncbi:MAG: MBL fold metallo-hydrolase [Planctomycetota bacterium]
MGYEIDFLPAGNGEKSGDAIAFRLGNLKGNRSEQMVVVIDGGFKETGEELVQHIKKYYNTSHVDIAISTHPDADHAAGLMVVLEQMTVGQLWMHQPWNHTDDIANMFVDGRVTDDGVREKLRKALEDSRQLETLANRKKIPIYEPFAGMKDSTGFITVAGPTEEYYESLLPEFRATPAPKMSFLERTIEAGVGLLAKVAEAWGVETLTDEGETSAENNSSVILRICYDGKNLLLTGDAGMPALTNAADYMEFILGADPSEWDFAQVPHHGSKRNVGPTILNRIVGPKLSEQTKKMTAFVSASKDGEPKHPAKKVTNAYLRRGAPVHATKGTTKRHSHEAPDRPGWSASTPLPFYGEVDE